MHDTAAWRGHIKPVLDGIGRGKATRCFAIGLDVTSICGLGERQNADTAGLAEIDNDGIAGDA